MSLVTDIIHKIFGTQTATATLPSQPLPATPPAVNVDEILSGLAKKHTERLDWQHSIVDLMKVLNMDSSLQNRKQLAKELGYTGSQDDSATMNKWLQKQVLSKIVENGGKLPEELLH